MSAPISDATKHAVIEEYLRAMLYREYYISHYGKEAKPTKRGMLQIGTREVILFTI
jgi:hypothetical protein